MSTTSWMRGMSRGYDPRVAGPRRDSYPRQHSSRPYRGQRSEAPTVKQSKNPSKRFRGEPTCFMPLPATTPRQEQGVTVFRGLISQFLCCFGCLIFILGCALLYYIVSSGLLASLSADNSAGTLSQDGRSQGSPINAKAPQVPAASAASMPDAALQLRQSSSPLPQAYSATVAPLPSASMASPALPSVPAPLVSSLSHTLAPAPAPLPSPTATHTVYTHGAPS